VRDVLQISCEDARASRDEDERLIKTLIQQQSSFETVNCKVRDALMELYSSLFKQMLHDGAEEEAEVAEEPAPSQMPSDKHSSPRMPDDDEAFLGEDKEAAANAAEQLEDVAHQLRSGTMQLSHAAKAMKFLAAMSSTKIET